MLPLIYLPGHLLCQENVLQIHHSSALYLWLPWRSTRIKALHKGYKARTCFDENCLACAVVAPPIKKIVVKNLCHKFDISEEDVDEEEAEDEHLVVPVGAN
jgi:hypothetical protein